MHSQLQTVESILSIAFPAIQVPELLQGQKGRVMKPSYLDELLPYGFGFEFENELPRELFDQFNNGIGQVRAALFALCNRYGLLAGTLSAPIRMGMVFNRAQDETIWHVDRSEREIEYYTFISPADSTVAQTRVSPVLHFLSVAESELADRSSLETIQTIRENKKTIGKITDQITTIADAINAVLNTNTFVQPRFSTRIEEESVLAGGKNGWLLFSDPLVIHNGNRPTGDDKHIMTFDLARREGENGFYSVYDNAEEGN